MAQQKKQQIEIFEEVTWPKLHQDIISGEIDQIYTSQNTFWWTHTIKDAKYFEPQKPPAKLLRSNPAQYAQRQGLYITMKEQWDQGIKHPYDPAGFPLMQKEAKEWLVWVETNIRSGHMGPMGRKALMVCHAQNSNVMMRTIQMANQIVGKAILSMARDEGKKPAEIKIYGI